MSNMDKKQKTQNGKKPYFSTALLLNLSPFGDNFKELNDGIENIKLNTSANEVQDESRSLMNDFLSYDLLEKIDGESPNPQSKEIPQQNIEKVSMEGGVNNDDISSDNPSSENENSDGNNSDIIIRQSDEQNKENEQDIPLVQPKNPILTEMDKQLNLNRAQQPFNRNQIPLCSYYDSTSKYLSQSLLDEKSKQMPIQNFNSNYLHKNSAEDYYLMNNMNPSPNKGNPNNQMNFIYGQNQMMNGMNMNPNKKFMGQNENFFDMQQGNYFNYMNMQNANQMNSNMNTIMQQQNIKQKTSSSSLTPSTTTNQSNKTAPKKKEVKEDDYVIEMFGRVGWICDQCNNFNYDTRNKCNRCGIPKSPKKISKLKRKLENKKKEQQRQLQKQQQQQSQKNKTDEDDKKKKLKERKGDWICAKCGNLNFSFRIICNRCCLSKHESEAIASNGNNGNLNMMKNPKFNLNLNPCNPENPQMMNFNPGQQFPYQIINNGQIYCNLNLMGQNNPGEPMESENNHSNNGFQMENEVMEQNKEGDKNM